MKRIIVIGVFLLIFCGSIFGNPVFTLIGERSAIAQTWTALPPYNFLWPLWDPNLSPIDALGVPTPLVSGLYPYTILPFQPGLAWNPDPDIGYPYFLYNSPVGMLYYDTDSLPYNLNPWPPAYVLDPNGALPITLPLYYNYLAPTDPNLIQEILSVDPNLVLHTAGFSVQPITGVTTKEGDPNTFNTINVKLTFPPLIFNTTNIEGGFVRIALYSSNTGEGTASPGTLLFDANNWDIDQSITITGVDDDIADGMQDYTIVLELDSTNSPSYSNLDPDDVLVINMDNDPGLIVSPIRSLETSENGGTATFAVRLSTAFSCFGFCAVKILPRSSDLSEGIVDPNGLIFNQDYWNVEQNVTVTGVNDNIVDGEMDYSIILEIVPIGVPEYAGLDPVEVPVTNMDNDYQIGIEKGRMKMISFVHSPVDSSAISVFGDGVRRNYQFTELFKIGTYDPELGDYIEYGENLIVKQGSGYWCYSKNGLNLVYIDVIPESPDPNIRVDLHYDSNSNDGWNMIACPHSINYLWDDVEVWGCNQTAPMTISDLAEENDCSCIDDLLIWKWKNGTYVYYDPDPNFSCRAEPYFYESDPDAYMKPNEGYWVKVLKEGVYLRFPVSSMPRVKRSDSQALIMSKIPKGEESLSASGKTINTSNDSPPAPPGNFGSYQDRSPETGDGGGCLIDTMSFGLPKYTH